MMRIGWVDRFFRQAREAGPAWNLGKTLLQIVVFWLAFLVVIPYGLARLERSRGIMPLDVPISPLVAWLGLALASLLGLTSGVLMAVHGAGTPLPIDAPRRLVVAGPYRYVRNPMAIAGLTQGACCAVLFESWSALAMVPAGFVVWNYLVRPLEERHMESVFGDEFRAYQRQVRCWVPRVRGLERGSPETGRGGGVHTCD